MKRAWIVRSDVVEKTQDSHASMIILKTRRSVSIKEGDSILGSENQAGKFRFIWQAQVEDVSARPLGELKRDVDPNLKLYSIQLADQEALEPARELQDLQYSLQKVWRLDRPSMHFRQPYTRVSEEDFETIIGDRIFWARTALLRFLTAVPPDLRAEILTHPDHAAMDDTRSGFRERWRRFREFLGRSYLPLTQLFGGIEVELAELGDLAPREAYFLENEEDRPDSIREQATRFREFHASLETPLQGSLLDEIDSHIEQNASTEQKFEHIFEATPWPPVIRER